jgi:threonine/homoserine/homoserine lactone efflux protein
MEKWLCWGSLGVSGILLLLFLLDLILGTPFGRIDWIVDIVGMIGCGLVGYLAWETFKDLR